nr:DUF4147 domain-containing protein [Deltaproteobacteria bacterium]
MSEKTKTIERMREDATAIFYAGLQAVEPGVAVKNFCRRENNSLLVGNRVYDLARFNNLFVVGAGKASAAMASAIEDLVGDRITSGIINVKYEHV